MCRCEYVLKINSNVVQEITKNTLVRFEHQSLFTFRVFDFLVVESLWNGAQVDVLDVLDIEGRFVSIEQSHVEVLVQDVVQRANHFFLLDVDVFVIVFGFSG